MECNDEKRLVIAENHLKGKAKHWWREIKAMAEELYQGSPWMLFLMEFLNHYIPMATREAKVREFESLEQGTKSVEEYGRRFTELLGFASHLASTPEIRARRYEQGLHPRIRERLTATTLTSFGDLHYQARKIEHALEEEDKDEMAEEVAEAPLDGFGNIFRSGIGCLPRSVERGLHVTSVAKLDILAPINPDKRPAGWVMQAQEDRSLDERVHREILELSGLLHREQKW